MRRRAVCALVLAASACAVVACSGAQTQSQAELGAITAGCKVSLDLERGFGEAGAADDTARGCSAALRTWEKAK